jgi:Mycothiol maleylpyruvate isomerase N-terminal domain
MTTMLHPRASVRPLFLESAQVVCEAVADDAVTSRWTRPSVLEGQAVGGVAGHVARGGVWVVDDYLDIAAPNGLAHVDSAVEYFVHFVESSTADQHRQVRERGAQVAADGPDAVAATVRTGLAALAERLPNESPDRVVVVAQGTVSMGLDEYLETRIVEQVVHLDDLARSTGRRPWALPPAAQDLVIRIGCAIGLQRHGATEVMRCLYRSHLDPVLPVL